MNYNINVGWPGPVSPKKYGSAAYEDQLKEILLKNTDLNLINIEGRYFKNRYLKVLESLFYLSKLKGKKDLWIRDFYSTVALFPNRTKGKNLIVIHHLDFSGFPLISRPFFNLLKKFFFYPNLRKADVIITVSEYWKNHLLKMGYKNVYKIYNSFNLSGFNISDKEVLDFKEEYNLQAKPVIYLGNCQRAKGAVESFKALKDLDVYPVTSGERKVKIPAMNLNLKHIDYLKLLKASSIVIAMSKFKEGWCRTAHEAMLLKTPVIGSGLGGMKELLEGGKQMVCKDFKDLREKVEYLLNHPETRKKMGEDGYNFAKEFTLERFEEKWLNLINKENES